MSGLCKKIGVALLSGIMLMTVSGSAVAAEDVPCCKKDSDAADSSAPSPDELALLQRRGHFDINLGGGITYNSPVRADVQLSGEYFVHDNVSVGLFFDAYLHTDEMYSGTVIARYHFDVKSLPAFTPYVGAGVGGGSRPSQGLLINVVLPNLGFKYAITPRFFFGADIGGHLFRDPSGTTLDIHFLFAVLSVRF